MTGAKNIMQFAERQPSSVWESIPLAGEPQGLLWAWFKPPAVPEGLAVQIPPETFQGAARQRPLTIRMIVHAAGIDPMLVASWSLYGFAYDAQQGASPAWNYPIPPPGNGVDPTIFLYLQPAPILAASQIAASPSAAPVSTYQGPQLQGLLRLEEEWNACIQLETKLTEAGRQLNATSGRVKSLTRDLSLEESNAADNADKQEWREVGRGLREAGNRLMRYIKDQQTGSIGTSGKRQACELIMQQYVRPRLPFPELEPAIRDFEVHRKSLSTLLSNMKAVQSYASDSLGRAQRILTRIATKVRADRTKRGLRG